MQRHAGPLFRGFAAGKLSNYWNKNVTICPYIINGKYDLFGFSMYVF